jgi:small-conductance mechanosensitive channel
MPPIPTIQDAPESFLTLAYRVLNYPLLTLGKGELTLGVIIKLVALCALVVIGERLLRHKFTMKVLKRTAFDAALQYAIARISGYVILLVGFYVALTAVGLNLSSLAVVAGAIGIGIGFGLQNIIQNFIAGIIILAERPIALGDRVEVGGIAGMVAKIDLRSTKIVTSDNISIIVPNSNFITSPVTNWSHGDPRVQMRIPIGVAYGTDIEKLKRVLTEVAVESPNALQDPACTVYFVAFGDSSLNFELGVWTKTMTHNPQRFRSELNYAIERKLRENKIEIPFPQRDLHIRSGSLGAPGAEPSAS